MLQEQNVALEKIHTFNSSATPITENEFNAAIEHFRQKHPSKKGYQTQDNVVYFEVDGEVFYATNVGESFVYAKSKN